jgi:hypothetical protein
MHALEGGVVDTYCPTPRSDAAGRQPKHVRNMPPLRQTMPREEKEWKKAQKVQGRGVRIRISETKLKRLEREGVLDRDEPIEYSTSVGASDGRARGFVGLRNADGE